MNHLWKCEEVPGQGSSLEFMVITTCLVCGVTGTQENIFEVCPKRNEEPPRQRVFGILVDKPQERQ